MRKENREERGIKDADTREGRRKTSKNSEKKKSRRDKKNKRERKKDRTLKWG